MTRQYPILSYTLSSFQEALLSDVGRGKDQIAALYKSFFKEGVLHEELLNALPCFANAPQLFRELFAKIDQQAPQLLCVREYGETKKFLLKTHDGYEIESVIIPMKEGITLCVSSQIGCRMGCAFCETGKMGLIRNLSVAEIVAQLHTARFQLQYPVRNVVFMGMGEPFDNYDAVMGAIDVMTDQNGLAIGMQRVTVSTSGRVDGILKLSMDRDRFPNLAVSVNAPEDSLRTKLMPWNRKENLSLIRQAMESYIARTGKEILAAYVLIGGVNDTREHAEKLASYLSGLAVKVNVIAYNPQACDPFTTPSEEALDAFVSVVREAGFRVLVRKTKGRDVMAACGQLGNRSLRKKRAIDAPCSKDLE